MKKRYMKRLIDLLIAFGVLIVLSPVFLFIAVLVKLDSKGGVFYSQSRIGKDFVPFKLLKFRTMKHGADKKSLLTVGDNDSRITRVGYSLRKYKLDEFPQLINVIKGEMSIVGPRPEVKKYVDLYTDDQKIVLTVKPGITDIASIKFRNESKLLSEQEEPEKYYINSIMPIKLALNQKYINEMNIWSDMRLIFKTLVEICINR